MILVEIALLALTSTTRKGLEQAVRMDITISSWATTSLCRGGVPGPSGPRISSIRNGAMPSELAGGSAVRDYVGGDVEAKVGMR